MHIVHVSATAWPRGVMRSLISAVLGYPATDVTKKIGVPVNSAYTPSWLLSKSTSGKCLLGLTLVSQPSCPCLAPCLSPCLSPTLLYFSLLRWLYTMWKQPPKDDICPGKSEVIIVNKYNMLIIINIWPSNLNAIVSSGKLVKQAVTFRTN